MTGFVKIGVNLINLNRVESIMILEDQINFYFDHAKGDEGLQVISKNVVPENAFDRLKKYIAEDLAELDFNKELS
jgi:hypothetical protein